MRELISALSGLLHNIYYFEPSADFIDELRTQQVLEALPDCLSEHSAIVAEMSQSLMTDSVDELRKDYYRLFIGPGKKLAYPWGSYYLDPEHLVFGESESRLRIFIQSHNVSVRTKGNEPLDHIGIIMGVLSQLVTHHPVAAQKLLTEHLCPWSEPLIVSIEQGARTGYFRGAAMLLRSFIKLANEELRLLVQDAA